MRSPSSGRRLKIEAIFAGGLGSPLLGAPGVPAPRMTPLPRITIGGEGPMAELNVAELTGLNPPRSRAETRGACPTKVIMPLFASWAASAASTSTNLSGSGPGSCAALRRTLMTYVNPPSCTGGGALFQSRKITRRSRLANRPRMTQRDPASVRPRLVYYRQTRYPGVRRV